MNDPLKCGSCCDGAVAGEPFKKKCLKDSTVPEYPVNIYYCYEESKAECCVEDMQYTCCEPEQSLLMYALFASTSLSLFNDHIKLEAIQRWSAIYRV